MADSTKVVSPIPAVAKTITINNVKSPGTCSIQPIEEVGKYEDRNPLNKQGGEKVFRGTEALSTIVTFTMWSLEDRQAWDPFYEVIKFPPSTERKIRTFQIGHELLAGTDWQIKSIQRPIPTDNGTWVAVVKLEELKPEKLMVQKAGAVKPFAGGAAAEGDSVPDDEEDMELAAKKAFLDSRARTRDARRIQAAQAGALH